MNQTPSSLPVREAVLHLLRQLGMTRMFGNPGSTELPLFRDFPADFDYVLGLQESVVVGMADGHAQATGNAAFVNLHSAVGVGHAMGAIFTAFRNKTPLVITAGQQARAILPFDPFLGSMQAAELPKPYVKWSLEPARAEDVPLAIARGYYIAMQDPKGPVLISVPSDDWDRPTAPVQARTVSTQVRPDAVALDRIGDALDDCERPAFVVGAAVDRGGAWEEAVALAERHRARVFAAPMTGRCSFPEDHPLFAGALPPRRQLIVQRLQGHDLIVALGAPAFTYNVVEQGPHIPEGATLCQITEDPTVAAWTPHGIAVVGSVRLALQDLLARAAPRERPQPSPRDAMPRAEAPVGDARMSVEFVMQTLATLRDPLAVVVEEAPSSRTAIQNYLPNTRPGTFHAMCSGGLGFGLPAAIGMAIANPATKVIAVIGDGSSMYAIQALWTAAQRKLPITIVIVKNRRYAALELLSRHFDFPAGVPLVGTQLPDIDFCGLARAQGCRAAYVADAAALEATLGEALHSPEPFLVEVEVA